MNTDFHRFDVGIWNVSQPSPQSSPERRGSTFARKRFAWPITQRVLRKGPNSKLQLRNRSRAGIQRSSKLQMQNLKHSARFFFWKLEYLKFLWSLDVGFWSFSQPSPSGRKFVAAKASRLAREARAVPDSGKHAITSTSRSTTLPQFGVGRWAFAFCV